MGAAAPSYDWPAMTLLPAEAPVRKLTLVRLAGELARSFATLGRVSVEGEVVRPSVARSGRVYFTLKDRAAQVRVACPPATARRCRALHGQRVAVTGSLSWVSDRGDVNLVAEEVLPVGEGAIAAMLAETRARLAADGLLDRPRLPIPLLPAAVGVVCGADAAVRADIESVVAARFPGYPLVVVEVAVSGPGAPGAVAAALAALDARPEVEVVVLARGGGDAASLLTFSDENLCRAVAASRTPVVSAIGHERDRPLCDEVADLRCGTPSLAAAAVVPDRAALDLALDRALEHGAAAVANLLAGAGAGLRRADPAGALRAGLGSARARSESASAVLRSIEPRRWLVTAAAALGRPDWRSRGSQRLEHSLAALGAHARTVEALAPARVLERGYAVVRGPGGAVLRGPEGLAAGDILDITLQRGRIAAAVADAGG